MFEYISLLKFFQKLTSFSFCFNSFANKFLVKYSTYKYCEENKLPMPLVYLTGARLDNFGILTFNPEMLNDKDINNRAQYIYEQLENYRKYIEPSIAPDDNQKETSF